MTELVFVYGTLRQGGSNNRFLANAELVDYCLTVDLFSLYVDRLSGLPYVVEGGLSRVVGEVYRVPSALLWGPLDELEEHPDVYRRKLVPVVANGVEYAAWMYIWPHPIENSFCLVPSGDFTKSWNRLGVQAQNTPRGLV